MLQRTKPPDARTRRVARNPGLARARSDLLVEALRGARFGEPDVQRLTQATLQAADHHGVISALRRAYGRSPVVEGLSGLSSMARNLRAVALRITNAGIDVSRWLSDAGVEHAILKGPALAAVYPGADRDFVDLDVLVAPEQMSAAIETLELHGAAVLESQAWPRTDRVGELTLGLPSAVAVDLHAELIHHEKVRRDFRLDPKPILSRVTRTEVLGQKIPVLDPEDTLTYVALHAAVSGGDRLIWLADLDRLVRHGQIRWSALISRARQARAALVVAVMLERASIVLGTPVPDDAFRELRRGGVLWARLLASFERRRPTASNYGRNVRGQVLVRATRSSTLTSAMALLRLIWSDVIVFVARNPGHPWRRTLRERVGRTSQGGTP